MKSTSARKTRADSNSAAVTAMADAAKPLPTVPKHVTLLPRDLPFWDAIVKARTRAEWSDCDLILAAQLARCQSDIEREYAQLAVEGTIVGTRTNPRAQIVEILTKRQNAIMRQLRLAGAGAVEMLPARKVQRESEAIREELLRGGGKGLLAS